MLDFSKYHGLGNDFIIFDGILHSIPPEIVLGNSLLIRKLCNRNFGIGGDGVLLLLPANDKADFKMIIYNSDGTQAEMCGNGIRCIVKYLSDRHHIKGKVFIETLAGKISADIDTNDNIEVDMGPPILDPINIPCKLEVGTMGLPEAKITIENRTLNIYSVGMGNPHMIVLVTNINSIPVTSWGPKLEFNNFFPAATNVHFVEITNRAQADIIVWERGVGLTLACGTGACACHVACNLLGLIDDKSTMSLPGGQLNISWSQPGQNVLMSGKSEFVFNGTLTDFNLLK